MTKNFVYANDFKTPTPPTPPPPPLQICTTIFFYFFLQRTRLTYKLRYMKVRSPLDRSKCERNLGSFNTHVCTPVYEYTYARAHSSSSIRIRNQLNIGVPIWYIRIGTYFFVQISSFFFFSLLNLKRGPRTLFGVRFNIDKSRIKRIRVRWLYNES